MTCDYPCWVPWTTNTTPSGFDEQRFQKVGLKGALVVVVEVVVVATTTATPSTFDTWTKVHLRLSSNLPRPRSLGSLLRRGSGGNHHWVSQGSWRPPGYTSNRKHTMTDHDITEIADARYMGLMCPPSGLQCDNTAQCY